MNKNKNKKIKNDILIPVLFISLSVILVTTMYYWPMFQAFLLSFQAGKGVNLKYVGLSNYIRLFTDDTFKKALYNTMFFLVIQVPMMLILGILLAVLLNNPKLKFKNFFRGAIFLPCVTSLVAYSVLFKNIFAFEGLINNMLLFLHIISEPIQWLTVPFWARIMVVIAITWRWTGYNMIFYLSGLQNIDPSIYESARIDGASFLKQFTKITIPLLRPIILFTTITSTIGTLQLFDEVANLTRGGPNDSTMTLSLYIYNVSFKYTPNFGYAAAISFVIVSIIVLFSIIQLKVGGEKNA